MPAVGRGLPVSAKETPTPELNSSKYHPFPPALSTEECSWLCFCSPDSTRALHTRSGPPCLLAQRPPVLGSGVVHGPPQPAPLAAAVPSPGCSWLQGTNPCKGSSAPLWGSLPNYCSDGASALRWSTSTGKCVAGSPTYGSKSAVRIFKRILQKSFLLWLRKKPVALKPFECLLTKAEEVWKVNRVTFSHLKSGALPQELRNIQQRSFLTRKKKKWVAIGVSHTQFLFLYHSR